jgi:leucyl-tRNA synthetase
MIHLMKKTLVVAPKLKPYDPAKIEKKWQKKWAASKIYKSQEARSSKLEARKDKFYVLDMFPYPSGEGLHVGHPKGYIATDVVSRMKRMQGMNVLHPMGFDAFGLPAENYAIKMKKNPMDLTAVNVERFKDQLELLGFDYDWSREINTTDPDYYRWTQWIFLQLFKKGLAYESFEPINWCPSCKTGLANEDVENGRCERCGTPVEKKPMRQWVLKITDYADRLLKDLDATTGIPLIRKEDGEDAVKKDMPLVERNAVVCVVKHWSEEKYLCLKWKKVDWKGFVIGGIEAGETPEDASKREISEETGYLHARFIKTLGKVESQFYQSTKKVNRHAHFTVVCLELSDNERAEVAEREKELHESQWVSRDDVRDFINRDDMRYIWDIFTGVQKQEVKPLLDWPEAIKESQRNWIGRSEGALIKFKVQSSKCKVESQKADSVVIPAPGLRRGQAPAGIQDQTIEVFTTRPDTLFGVTYVVLAPEHKLVGELLACVENRKEVEDYINRSKLETDIERTDASKEKTGVELKGVKAVNPANNEEVPVWIADYVLADYGTGAVMAVPAHDERDWEFAKKFKLPIRSVIAPTFGEPNPADEPVDGSTVIVFDQQQSLYACLHWHNPERYTIISGTKQDDESYEETAKRELKEEAGISDVKSWHKLGDKLFAHYFSHSKNKYKYGSSVQFLAVVDSNCIGEHSREPHETFDFEWKTAEEILGLFEKTMPKSRHLFEILGRAVLVTTGLGIDKTTDITKFDFVKSVPFVEPSVLIDSGQFTGKDSSSVKKEITASVGGQWVTKYKLRDWVFSRQRYWGEPIPLIHCPRCGVVPVPEKDLPVKLPKVKSYEPTGTGESPLASIDSWVNVKCPQCKGPAKRETNTMPQWAGSSWYYLRYEDPKNKKALVDPKKEKYWSPVDLYIGGAEHATRHLIYSRFWHKFLYDIGVVSTIEPFIKLQSVGLIMGEDGRKMSKRFGNVINPDDIVKQFGADTLRIYEMFMGPFDQSIAWSSSSMAGPRRFIERVWKLREKIGIEQNTLEEQTNDRILHKTIKKVTCDIDGLRFNTAISTLMIALNEFDMAKSVTRLQFESYLKLLAPFAPHVTEETWSQLGNKKSIHISQWPTHNPNILEASTMTIILQINGKTRGSFTAAAGAGKEELEKKAKESPEAKKWLEGKQIKRVVTVPGRLVNIVAI